MYYQTPKMERYVAFIMKNRIAIIVAFILLTLGTLILYQPKVHSSDAMFWLKDAKEFQKTKAQHYDTYFLSKLSIDVEHFDEKSKQTLQKIQKEISTLPDVKKVSSLFSHTLIQKERASDSSMVGVVNVASMDSYKIKALANKLSNPYGAYVDNNFHTFHFYILSSSEVNIQKLKIKQTYRYMAVDYTIDWHAYLIYVLISIVMIIALFKLIFSNYISSISAILVVSITTVLTFAIIGLVLDTEEIYIIMPFISLSIALVDYMFFYYRWHVSQYQSHMKSALVKMLNRNLTPALWTSLLTMIGLGGLLFVHSEIIRLLSLSLIVSSLVGYFVNLTFLPAFLSYFHIKHAHVNYAKICYAFASSELHYNKKFLLTLLSTTLLLLILALHQVSTKSSHLFKLHVKNDQILIMVPYKKIDLTFIKTLRSFTADITKAFPDSIDEVHSLASGVDAFNEANAQTNTLDVQALEQALFYLDFYGMGEELYDENAVKITIHVFGIDKNKLIQWLQNYAYLDIYFVDKGTLLNSAMYDKTVLLSVSLLSALLIMGIIAGWIFRSFSMAFVGFIVNAIPIVWFGLIVNLLKIPLSLEMLIAMTISVGLASDATIHFAFKYFRSRYFGRSQKHSLEKMFFYAGVPVIVGSLILVVIFTLLGFSDIYTLQQIGKYAALLILLSLGTDLFILPVILLYLDKFEGRSKQK